MEIGDTVTFRIKSYPYERTGTIVKICKVHSIVRVQYPSKYMLIKKKNEELKKVLDISKKSGDNSIVVKNRKGETHGKRNTTN